MALIAPTKREAEVSFSTRTRTPPKRAVVALITTLFNSSTTCFSYSKGMVFLDFITLFLACHKEEIW
jgi:hypothetical protein